MPVPVAAPAQTADDHGRLSDEAKAARMAEVARRRQTYGQSIQCVADAMNISKPDVSKSYTEALNSGVLAFSIDPRFGLLGELDRGKAHLFKDAFNLTRCGLVVTVDAMDLGAKATVPFSADDYLHTVLANRTGEDVVTHLDADDHLAVGPGRPVNHVAHYIARKSTRDRPWERIRVTPLAGRLGAHKWAITGPGYARAMDSDDASYIVALALENLEGTEFSWIGHSLFAVNAGEAERIMQESCRFQPDGTWLEGKVPTRAIIGVGAVHPRAGHRLAGLRPDNPGLNEFLGEDANELSALIGKAGSVDCLLCDVVNRYYLSLPLPDKLAKMPVKDFATASRFYEGELLPAVQCLNQRVVAARWGHLRQIPRLTAVAGGLFKREALWTLLLAGWPPGDRQHVIKALNTDSDSADTLLNARQFAWRECAPERQQWCISMADRMFSDT